MTEKAELNYEHCLKKEIKDVKSLITIRKGEFYTYFFLTKCI